MTEVSVSLPQTHGVAHLATVRAAAGRPDLGLGDRQYATHALIAYGETEAARESLARFAEMAGEVRGLDRTVANYAARLAALEAFGIGERVRALGPLGERLLDEGRQTLVRPARPRGLLVVFATMFNNFELSLPALHCFLADTGYAVLYLKDPTKRLFLGGVSEAMPSFGHVVERIAAAAEDAGTRNVRVAGYSSSGYASLLAAHRAGARAYLGFSIRTDLAAGSPRHPGKILTPALREVIGEERLVDLRPALAARPSPGGVLLVYGTASRVDVLHAEHLAGLPNLRLMPVAGANHNVTIDLVASGRFRPLLEGFLAEA